MKEHPISAGVVIVRYLDGELHCLLLRAYQYWDFPKGLVEKGEDSLVAAMREVEEETTLQQLDFRWGYDFRDTLPYGKFQKIARYYIAESVAGDVDLPVSEELGHPEHEEFRWVDVEVAREMVSPRVQDILHWAHSIIGDK